MQRLKDINIISKARNFLVFQGDVESLASKQPKDLTLLFEQISGSGAMKPDYENAQVEKEKAEEELKDFYQRRKGINSEKKQFKEQKDEADKFQKLTNNRDQIEVQYFLFQLWDIQRQMKGSLNMANLLGKDVEIAKAEQTKAEEQERSRRRALAKEQSQLVKFDDQIRDKNRELKKVRPKRTKILQQLEHCKKKIEEERAHLQQAERDVSKQEATVDKLERDIKDIARRKNKYEAEITGEGGSADITLATAQLEQYNKLKSTSKNQTMALQSKIDEVQRTMRIATENLSREEGKLSQFCKTRDAQESRAKNFELRREKLAAQMKEQEVKVLELTDQVTAHSKTHSRDSTKLENARAQLTKIDGQLREAKADKNESERDRKFLECLEEMKRLFPGVKGRLMDLCSPTHKRFNAAITVVMGKNMDAIVVDTVETAKSCMQYLKVQKGGVATFIPLQTIEGKPVDERLRNLGGTKRPVVDVIKYSADITRAIEFACGAAIVCDTLQEAKALCFGKGRASKHKCVTIDGTLIRRSGVMTGGLTGVESRAAKWEQKAIDELKRERIQYQRDVTALQSSVPSVERSLDEAKSQLAAAKQRLSQFQQDMEITTMNINKLSAKVEEKEITQIEDEINKYSQAAAKAKEKVTVLERERDAVVDQVFAEFCASVGINNIRDYEGTEIKVQRERARKLLEFDSHISRLQSSLEFEKSRLVSSQVRIAKKAIAALQEEFGLLETQSITLSESMTAIEEKLATLINDQNQFKTKVDEIDVSVRELKKQVNSASDHLNSAQQKMASKLNDLKQARSKRRSLLMACLVEEIEIPLKKGKMENVALAGMNTSADDTMDVDERDVSVSEDVLTDAGIEINFDELSDEIRSLEDPSDVASVMAQYTEKLKKIASKIDNMAPNMKAVEKLDGVRKRLKAIEVEFDAARERAEKADSQFRAMQKKRFQLFDKAYTHISGQIDTIYKELTRNVKSRAPGGTAYLTLESNEEPYLYGIKYNTMPPSKRFRDMEQLSGGEKTVAALALLFAIHSFRPSPFFIMDEIDAALDAVNVHKVATYIKQRSGDFQCIVISLKDSFYDKADGIVGIYRDKALEASNSLTLDLRPYDDTIPSQG
ncbi:hypothetical protein, variant [Sphaeroforma arctica JP610]|nr:hypothetical protein, variant [Sphaeroforma arctica JP610]KNC80623.1 hypothetical protein, variant [Sphaeroforma arctica JP610]|eukprot:XP_014154525.1 hypothetical protein, variant [Sphaeroforma arctica JP610]